MLTKSDMAQLEVLARGIQAGPTMTDDEIRITQRLVTQGLAKDYSEFHGHRQRIYLRIWGITTAGRAVLEQQALTMNDKRTQLLLSMKPTVPTEK